MWFRSLFNSLSKRLSGTLGRRKPRRSSVRHGQLESLEDRCMLDAAFAYNLGTLGGDPTYLTDINLHGQVAGYSKTAADSPGQGAMHAFIWDRGTMIDLGALGGPTYYSSAWGINDLGQVAGVSYRPDPNGGYDLQRGFLVTPEDTDGNGTPDRWYRDLDGNGINDLMGDLGTLGGTHADAYDINNAGQVVGMSATAADDHYAFRWQNGQMTSLGSLIGWSYGQGINDTGQVVGSTSEGPAFHWDSVRGLTNLLALPGGQDQAIAFDINNAGVVVGTSGLYQTSRAVTWSPSIPNGTPGSAVSLGALPGDNASDATDINNLGQVVGHSHEYIVDPYWGYIVKSTRAFLWQSGTMTALEDLMGPGSGWSFSYASAINDAEQIVGSGRDPNGHSAAFLLSPVDIGIPLLSISDVAIVEGNGGMSNAVFTVSLSVASSRTISAAYATAPGSASSGLDYVAGSGTVTFNPGETSTTITVPVHAETLDEHDETFFVNLSRTTNAAFADSQALGTISNDDPVPALEVSDVTVVEGNAGTTDAVFTITLSPAADRERTVWFQTEGYNDEYYYTDDFEVVGGYLTFAPGETAKSFTVRVFGDTIPEPDETFRVLVSYDGAASLSDDGIGTIQNAMLDVSNPTLVEGNAGTTNAVFTVTLLNGPLAEPATFTYQTADGGATAGSDYQAVSGTITFAPGEINKTITVLVNGDRIGESDELFFVNLSNPNGASLGAAQAQGIIVDDEPDVWIDNAASIPEGNSGQTAMTFTLHLSAEYDEPVTVNYATVDGSAIAGSDYVGVTAGTATIAANTMSQTITVQVNGDTLAEGDEYLAVNVTGVSGATLSGGVASGTILNDDTPPAIYIGDASVVEGNSGTKLLTFTVSLSKAGGQDLWVNYATANGSATTSNNDYLAGSGTIYFAPGETTKTIAVSIKGDAKKEKDERFYVNLSGAIGGTIADSQGVGTIVNDDGGTVQGSRKLRAAAVDAALDDWMSSEPKKRGQ